MIALGSCFLIPLISYADHINLPDVHESSSRFCASGSANAAFLTDFPVQRASYLEAFADKSNGDFINFNQSDNAYQAGLKTESYFRLNNRILLYGQMSYGLDRGRHMSGSAFICPDETPFDLIEWTDDCSGSKRFEAYTLQGAMGIQLNSRWALGGHIYYQAANYAKYKDLRHQNSQMNLQVQAGASYQLCDWAKIGLNYTYRRNNEAIAFGIYGNSGEQYQTLISYGCFFGRTEYYGESGYTSEKTPLFTQSHGAALQLLLQPTPTLSWFNQFHGDVFDGQYGTGDDRDITYSTHQGHEWGYQGKWSWTPSAHTHVLEADLKQRYIENDENSYKQSTDASGVTQIKYYGANQTLDRTRWQGSLSYIYYRHTDRARTPYHLGARLQFLAEESKVSVFPFYRKQQIHVVQGELFGTYNWFHKENIFSLSATLGYGRGGGTPKEDGWYLSPSDSQKKPARRDDLLMKDFDFKTASQLSGSISFGYERRFMPGLSGYLSLGAAPRYALSSSFKQDSHWRFDLHVGVKF